MSSVSPAHGGQHSESQHREGQYGEIRYDEDPRGKHSGKPRAVIGVDLGGTAIKLGCFREDGHCLKALSCATPQPSEPRTVLDKLSELIRGLQARYAIAAIGVGTPGPVDQTRRVARVAINLAGWSNVPLADWIEAATSCPTVLANDANCAGLGEAWLGAGRPFENLIMLTLGTGVGGAIVLNRQLFLGPHGAAGELGLITIDPQGPPCNSGNSGSLEQHLSVQAIHRRTGHSPAELGQWASEGNPEAIAFWQGYGKHLGVGLASLIYVLTPEAIIIGGGISASAEFFLPSVWSELKQRVLPSSRADVQLLVAQLGNRAGMVGAAKLAWQTAVAGQSTTARQNADPQNANPQATP